MMWSDSEWMCRPREGKGWGLLNISKCVWNLETKLPKYIRTPSERVVGVRRPTTLYGNYKRWYKETEEGTEETTMEKQNMNT